MSSDVRYAVLTSWPAAQHDDIAAARRPRRDWLDIAEALDAGLIDPRPGSLPQSTMFGLLAAWTAFRRRAEYDVILTAERTGLPLALLLKATGTRRGHVMIAHWLSPRKKRILLQWFGAADAIDRLVVYGSAQERFALDQLKLPRRKIEMLRHAADAKFWHPLGLPRSGICSAGLEHRDYDTFVEAVRGLDVGVTIAATSPWTDRGGAVSRELPPNVARRSLNYQALRELYDRSEFVVVPLLETDFQAGSLVIYEAMAMGKAVIVSRTRGHADGDIVREGETGLFVPPGDIGALRQAILRLHGDPAEAQRMGANARRIVERGLNHETYVHHIVRIAREVGAERRHTEPPPMTR